MQACWANKLCDTSEPKRPETWACSTFSPFHSEGSLVYAEALLLLALPQGILGCKAKALSQGILDCKAKALLQGMFGIQDSLGLLPILFKQFVSFS